MSPSPSLSPYLPALLRSFAHISAEEAIAICLSHAQKCDRAIERLRDEAALYREAAERLRH